MPERRLRRFLHLERARPEGDAAEPARDGPAAQDAMAERIAGLERPAAPAASSPRTGAQLGRFGPEPEPTIELAETDGRRPFVRCRRCSTDNNLFTAACTGCGLSLDTAEQHEFDERFWAARQAEADLEARKAQARQELRARAEAEDARARRAMAEGLAREVGDAERRRLAQAGLGGRLAGRGEWNPLGLRLVRRIPDPRWHVPVMALASGLAAVVAAYGVHAHSGFLIVLGAAALAALLVNVPE